MSEKHELYARNWEMGQLNALVKNLTEDVARRIASGDLFLVPEGDGFVLKKKAPKLYDKNGRRIPAGLTERVSDPNPRIVNFARMAALESSSLANLEERWEKVYTRRATWSGYEFAEFSDRVVKLSLDLQKTPDWANLYSGTCLPIMIPGGNFNWQGFVRYWWGSATHSLFEGGYAQHKQLCLWLFDKTSEYGWNDGYSSLYMTLVDKPVVALYFPFALSGFSPEAQIEQFQALPKGFALTGLLDFPISLLMYPDFLVDDFSINYDLCAVKFCKKQSVPQFHLKKGSTACLNSRRLLHESEWNGTGGLLYIGE